MAGTQAAGFYRRKVGAFEVTAMIDGVLPLGREMFPGAVAAPAEADRLLARAFEPRTGAVSPINAFAVNTGDRLVLIDAGTSNSMGPGFGAVPRNLEAAGMKPEDVDLVLLTHLHPDHAGGLLKPDGAPQFPNAEVAVAEPEHAFWTNDAILAQAPAEARPFFEIARRSIAPYAARLRRFAPGTEVSPGLTTIAAPGHTPGHTLVRIASGSDQLLVIADSVHSAALQFARPDWAIGFDADPAAASASRRRVLDMAAADRLLLAGSHLPFPGLGRVLKDGDAYAYVPEPWRPL
jgi:glyoxylase-like metal-dependent hydrolase (beta-lactamase superfamily II)